MDIMIKKLPSTEDVMATQKARNEKRNERGDVINISDSPEGCDKSGAVEYFNILHRRALSNSLVSEVGLNREATEVEK